MKSKLLKTDPVWRFYFDGICLAGVVGDFPFVCTLWVELDSIKSYCISHPPF